MWIRSYGMSVPATWLADISGIRCGQVSVFRRSLATGGYTPSRNHPLDGSSCLGRDAEERYVDGSRPGAPVTREEQVAMMYRMRKLIGGNTARIVELEKQLQQLRLKNDGAEK